MAARAMWKAVLVIDDHEIPVKLYSGLEDRSVHFRLLHRTDFAPVRQVMVDPHSEREVEREQIRRGAPVGGGRFVVLTEEDLVAAEPPESREITIDSFVAPEAIDPAMFDRPYWLGPDPEGDSRYWQLAEALARQEKLGVARWVMRKRAYVGALRLEGEHLMLVTLRHAGELVAPDEIAVPRGRSPEPQELTMAKQLVAMLEGDFKPDDFRDEHRDRVLDLVRRKQGGEVIELVKAGRKREPASLTSALKRSLEALGPQGVPRSRRQRHPSHD